VALAISVMAWYPVVSSAGDISSRLSVPAGTVIMGADASELKGQISEPKAKVEWYMDETPQKKVELPPFFIDATEVTNAEYKKIVPDHSYPPNLANHPVVNVTWDMADDYCRKAGGALPTEAQWERAARGDDGRVYPWGDQFDPAKAVYVESVKGGSKQKVGSFSQEQSGSSLLGGTSPVASREGGRSPFGAYDMAGNVWEWVDGYYDKSKGLRLLKGGSWLSPQSSLRSSTRLGDEGGGKFNDYGFRCVYDHK